jgi:dTDP-4-dehydrorhamnose reductase
MGASNHLPLGVGGKILVTGANGQMGKELQQLAPSFPQYEFIFLSRADLPIHHFEMVRHFFEGYHPQYLINCAAYTAVDRAEEERDKAFQVNGEAVGVLAAICKAQHCQFIHMSTDYVFDGVATVPYTEKAPTNPQSVYGASKLLGEQEAMRFNTDSLIIRTSWVYSEFGKNFVKTMLKLLQEKEEVSVVNDQFGSPTYAADLAEAILKIIGSGKWEAGIYHYCNEGVISWFEFASAIKEMTANTCTIKPIPGSAYPTAAKRPAYSALDTSKIRVVYSVENKDWKESLASCLARLR